MTSPTIQFDIPDDEDREIGVVAWFTMGIHVPEFGGTVGVRGKAFDKHPSVISNAVFDNQSTQATFDAWVRVRCREWLRGRG